jgi:ribonucleoside-diphosphate reductase alpha chain
MGVLRVDHPDIFDFVACKSGGENFLTGFNISVGLTDKFMGAYTDEIEGRGDGSFDLINPRTNASVRTVHASEIMDVIVKNAHRNGEPGILFLDEINRKNPMSHMYKIETTNPCGRETSKRLV